MPAARRSVDVVQQVLGVLVILLGGLLAGVSYAHRESGERAVRLGEPLPHSPIPRPVAAALSLTAAVAVLLSLAAVAVVLTRHG